MCFICKGKYTQEKWEAMTRLYCSGCKSLTFLPELPGGLTEINCGYCMSLTSLPELPAGLTVLFCENCTSLTNLPELPAGLTELYCSDCKSLTSLPELPAGLAELDCRNCTWLPNDNPKFLENIRKLKLLQKVLRKAWYRRYLTKRYYLKQKITSTDLVKLILSY